MQHFKNNTQCVCEYCVCVYNFSLSYVCIGYFQNASLVIDVDSSIPYASLMHSKYSNGTYMHHVGCNVICCSHRCMKRGCPYLHTAPRSKQALGSGVFPIPTGKLNEPFMHACWLGQAILNISCYNNYSVTINTYHNFL